MHRAAAQAQAAQLDQGVEGSVLGLAVFRDGGVDGTVLGYVHPHGSWIDWRA